MSRICQIDGCDMPAPFGFRRPGPVNEIPPNKRGVLWVCNQHRDEARRRRDAALNLKPNTSPARYTAEQHGAAAKQSDLVGEEPTDGREEGRAENARQDQEPGARPAQSGDHSAGQPQQEMQL